MCLKVVSDGRLWLPCSFSRGLTLTRRVPLSQRDGADGVRWRLGCRVTWELVSELPGAPFGFPGVTVPLTAAAANTGSDTVTAPASGGDRFGVVVPSPC